ncbi:MAG: hypothetical protein PHT07_10695 [Paludibacter sp.]|nr:hypothetical protein [Paludibacter sp.]
MKKRLNMENNTIAPKVQEITIKLKEAIGDTGIEVNKSKLYPERKQEILEELEKISFVIETLFLENNYEELEKSLLYVGTLRANIPNWEGRDVDYTQILEEQ